MQGKPITSTEEDEVGLLLITLVELLKDINLSDPLVKLNETTMTDNNGGRIEL